MLSYLMLNEVFALELESVNAGVVYFSKLLLGS